MVVPISESNGTLESVASSENVKNKKAKHSRQPEPTDDSKSDPAAAPKQVQTKDDWRSLAEKLATPCYATWLFLPPPTGTLSDVTSKKHGAAVPEPEPLYLPEPLCQESTESDEYESDEYETDDNEDVSMIGEEKSIEDYHHDMEQEESNGAFHMGGDDGRNNTRNVDEWLVASQIQQIQQSSKRLLSQPLIEYSAATTRERILYVTQREVAHMSPMDCDVIMSDRATTCHILIVRSTTTTLRNGASTTPLVTCAHLDGPYYDACLQQIFHRHYVHHATSNGSTNQYSSPPTYFTSQSNMIDAQNKIQMELHIAGGFLDNKGRSRDLSNWLLHSLAELAAVYSPVIHCTLHSCLISMMNHDSTHSAPRARGLACHLRSGNVFLARCSNDMSCMGPDPVLRLARLWSSTPQPQLILVNGSSNAKSNAADASSGRANKRKSNNTNTDGENTFRIRPFGSSSNSDIPWMLSLDDKELLKNSSTSPTCEEDDYCESVRQSLRLLMLERTETYFAPKRRVGIGKKNKLMTRKYQRSKVNPNEWILLPPHGKPLPLPSFYKKAKDCPRTEVGRPRKPWRKNQQQTQSTQPVKRSNV